MGQIEHKTEMATFLDWDVLKNSSRIHQDSIPRANLSVEQRFYYFGLLSPSLEW
jgi:hypothetical protein